MRFVVTGATGNIGTSVLRALARDPEPHEVLGIARRLPELRVPHTAFVQADISSHDLVPYFRGADAVIHLAWLLRPAREAEQLHRVNIEGTRRVLQAVASAKVPAVVVASSVGAYSYGPKDVCVDESWPTHGIPSSLYSRQKVRNERAMDVFERVHPAVRLVRMRPALVFKRGAASEQKRLFIGRWLPRFLFARGRLPLVPDAPRLRFQCVHSHDVARAFVLAAKSDVRGAFNIASDPVLDADVLAELLRAQVFRVSAQTLRRAVATAYRLRLTPTDPGWVDLAFGSPLIDPHRAHELLGWEARWNATSTLRDLLDGLHDGAGIATAPLHS